MLKRFTLSLLALVALTAGALGQELLKQSTAYNAIVFATDSADHLTGKTGLTFTITASKDGATFASITPTVTELANGWYKFALTSSHTDTVGTLAIHATATGADPVDLKFQIRGNVLGDTLPANTTQISGTAQTAGDAVAKLNLIAPSSVAAADTTYALVAQASVGSSTGINATTASANMTGANLFVACINCLSSGTAPTLSDSSNNYWSPYATYTYGGMRHMVFYCIKPRISATQTFTVTSAGLSPSLFVAGFRGANLIAPAPLDQVTNATATATTIQPGSLTPAGDNYLTICMNANFGAGTPSLNSGFAYQSLATNASGNHIGGGLGYKIQTTATASNPTWTISSGSPQIASQISFAVNTVATTIAVDSYQYQRVFPLEVGSAVKRTTITGTYTNAAPKNIEIATYDATATALVQNYQPLEHFQAYAGTWTGDLEIPAGGMYRFKGRGLNQNGELTCYSNFTNGGIGIGYLIGITGQSNAYKMFDPFGTPPTPDSTVSMYSGGKWQTLTGNGAITFANKITEATGLPVGLIHGAEAGTGLVYNAGAGFWLDVTPGEPWPNFQTQIQATGGDLTAVFWQGCEADADNPSFDADTLKAGFDTLRTRIAAELPTARNTTSNFKFYIGNLATLTDVLTTDARVTSLRDTLREKGDESAGFALADNSIDATMSDAWHYDGASYTRKGLRWAQTFLRDQGYETKSGVGPRILNAYRTSGSADIYVQLVDLASDGIVELDGTSDGGSLTGFELSDDDFATQLTVSSTAIVGRCLRLRLSSTPADADTVKYRFAYGETPAKTNFPYRNLLPQGDTVGLPLWPKSASTVELRQPLESTYYLAQATLARRLPLNYGYKILGGDGAELAARTTSPINVLSETESSLTLGTYFLAPDGFVDSGGYAVWDNGSAPAVDTLAATRGITISPTFVDEDDTWTFDSPTQITSAKILAEGKSTAILKSIDFSEPITKYGSLQSVTSVAVTDIVGATEPTITSSELSPDHKKVNILFNTSAATSGTYEIVVTVRTIDSQTPTRKVKLTIE